MPQRHVATTPSACLKTIMQHVFVHLERRAIHLRLASPEFASTMKTAQMIRPAIVSTEFADQFVIQRLVAILHFALVNDINRSAIVHQEHEAIHTLSATMKSNRSHLNQSVVLTQTAHHNRLASTNTAKIRALKPMCVRHSKHVRLSIHCHYEPSCASAPKIL